MCFGRLDEERWVIFFFLEMREKEGNECWKQVAFDFFLFFGFIAQGRKMCVVEVVWNTFLRGQ